MYMYFQIKGSINIVGWQNRFTEIRTRVFVNVF